MIPIMNIFQVGKIEGYQELTNKLQRYLNQRFIVDIDQLTKTQESINQVFGGDLTNINLIQKFEALEEKVGNLERTNESLVEQINVLKERDKPKQFPVSYQIEANRNVQFN